MKSGGTQWAALAALNLAAVVFGSTALFGKLTVSPVWIVAGRGAFAALALLALALIRRTPLRMNRRDGVKTVTMGALLALHWVTFFMSVQQAGIAVATLTFATFPLITVLIDSATRRRFPAPVELGSGAAIVLAVLLLVASGLPDNSEALEGAFVGLSSAAAFAQFSLGSQRLGRTVDAVTLSLYQNGAVALLLLPILPFAPPAPHGVDWAILAGLGVVATAFMHQLYFFGLKRLPASVCAGFVALEPVYAILFAAGLFSEDIGPAVIVSSALIVGASFVLLGQNKTRLPMKGGG